MSNGIGFPWFLEGLVYRVKGQYGCVGRVFFFFVWSFQVFVCRLLRLVRGRFSLFLSVFVIHHSAGVGPIYFSMLFRSLRRGSIVKGRIQGYGRQVPASSVRP